MLESRVQSARERSEHHTEACSGTGACLDAAHRSAHLAELVLMPLATAGDCLRMFGLKQLEVLRRRYHHFTHREALYLDERACCC